MNADGSELKKLSDGNSNDLLASWSRDGTRIYFSSDRLGEEPYQITEIFSMNIEGGDVKQITRKEGKSYMPYISPNGKKILFWADYEGNSDIYVVDVNGENLIQLTDAPEFDNWANWSPDGKKIAFTSQRSGWLDIYVMNSDGSNLKRLTYGAEGKR